ncbi:MAG: D-glycero-beta-D-manno-heptose 1-phosphate adenylyltransferase [Ignavibacteria bacterium]|jgi:rfaE bifunctional protein nucleotidyltransferase chain/domain
MIKLNSLDEIISLRNNFKQINKTVVFTNGCFDILHSGHVDYLNKAKSFGDILIVGLNSDKSVKSIKGEKRPIICEIDRAFLLLNLKSVDYIVLFDEDTPDILIKAIIPDVLVKGADWELEKIVGKKEVEEAGGRVERVEFVSQLSTSRIINTILDRYKN